jgi:hypothetical protein
MDSNIKRLQALIDEAQDVLIGLATGGRPYEKYEEIRAGLLKKSLLSHHVPRWIKDCRSSSEYWSFIKSKFGTYQERRQFLWSEFKPLFQFIEQGAIEPTLKTVEEALSQFTSESIAEAWQRCFSRRESDPEGAITAARAMLETTCKHILHELQQPFGDDDDLPKLYKTTAKSLRLAPEQHQEQVIKQILNGCGFAVEGLGAMRNKLGDAHGPKAGAMRPEKRHAALAVNLSGTICSFLIATFEKRAQQK